MTKIILTQEHAEAIERYLRRTNNGKGKLINRHAKGEWTMKDYYVLNDLNQSELAHAVLIGYEVEPGYQNKDWITCKGGEKFALGEFAVQVEGVRDGIVYFDVDRTVRIIDIRHSHPEEIKAEQERREWAEIEEGDVLIHKEKGIVGVFIESNESYVKVKLGKIHQSYTDWHVANCELYAKKVNKDV